MRFLLSKSSALATSVELVSVSQIVKPLKSVRTMLPSWNKEIREPRSFTGRSRFAIQVTVLFAEFVNRTAKQEAFVPSL
ncbi:hypothetical protein AAC387_Pa07g3843 [Persea americana]